MGYIILPGINKNTNSLESILASTHLPVVPKIANRIDSFSIDCLCVGKSIQFHRTVRFLHAIQPFQLQCSISLNEKEYPQFKLPTGAKYTIKL